MKKLFYILSMTLLCFPVTANAHDFEIGTKDGQRLYFNITDSVKRTVEVTYSGSITSRSRNDYKGTLKLTPQVRYKNKIFSITAIGAKAFSGSTELTSVELPSGILHIDDFAFEGCSKLTRIAFPSNAIKIGTGAFFGCRSLNSIVVGGEWTSINLKDFQWSQNLRHIRIPARVRSIKNLKALGALESIEIDSDNQNFKSVNGVLYSKSGDILYGCPKAYKDTLLIADGTKTIQFGSIADCRKISCVVIPASVESLSFREFSLLPKLKEIVMMANKPIMTARSNGKDVFLLSVANTDVKLLVNKQYKKDYSNQITVTSGEYTNIPSQGTSDDTAQMVYEVNSVLTIGKGNIVGVKDFNHYK